MPLTLTRVQQSARDVKTGNSESKGPKGPAIEIAATTSKSACADLGRLKPLEDSERIERLSPSMRDGESVGLLERKAAWLARAYEMEYSDALEEMIWFLWRRPDLLVAGMHSDGWLANRCVYHVRSRVCRQRARAGVPLDDVEETLGARDDFSEVADLLDALAPQVQALANAILEDEDATHQSSGRLNVSCLARKMGVRPETVRARVREAREALSGGLKARNPKEEIWRL